MCFGLYADSAEDIRFRQYVEENKKAKNNPKGMSICADYTYRIIFSTMPLAVNYSDVTPRAKENMRKGMLAELLKDKAACKVMKDLKITIVFTVITSDKRAFSVVLSYKDL